MSWSYVESFPALEASLGLRVGVALAILVATWVLSRLFHRAVDRFVVKRHLAESDPGAITRFKMIMRLGTAALYFLGAGLALYVINVSVFRQVGVAMFASAGIVGIAIAFASQTTAANLVSGVLIAFAQPLRLGDRIEVDTEQGIVEEIGLLYTSIRTWDNRMVLIPNQFLSTRVIRNFSLKDPRTLAALTFTVKHGVDVDEVRELLLREAVAHPLHLGEPAPVVEVVNADDQGLTVRLLVWAADKPQSNGLVGALRERAFPRLAAAGMLAGVELVPPPVRDEAAATPPPPPQPPRPAGG